MGITMGWVSKGFIRRPGRVAAVASMTRLPAQGDRLERIADGARFEVAHVTRIEGGELHFVLRGPSGGRVSVCVEELFPPLGQPQPYRSAA